MIRIIQPFLEKNYSMEPVFGSKLCSVRESATMCMLGWLLIEN